METCTGSYRYEWKIHNLANGINQEQEAESPVFPQGFPEAKSNFSSVNDYRWKMSIKPKFDFPGSHDLIKFQSQVVKKLLFKLTNVVTPDSYSPTEDVWVKYSLSITSVQTGKEIGSILNEIYKLDEHSHWKAVNIEPQTFVDHGSQTFGGGYGSQSFGFARPISTPRFEGICLALTIDTLSFRLKEIPPENINFHSSKFAQSLRCTLDDPLYSDIKIHVGEVEIKAHKIILSAMSEVFAAMMEHEFIEKSSGCIVISDFDADMVRTFLGYIYGGDVIIPNCEVAENLLKISDKYAVEGLKQHSSNFLAREITVSNFADVLLLAEMYQLSSLKTRAIDFFLLRSQAIIRSTSFARIEKENPSLLTELLKKLVMYKQQELNARELLLNKN